MELESRPKLERSNTIVKLAIDSDKKRTKFTDLTGDVLDLISEYLPNSEVVPPSFILTNSSLVKNYTTYKKENYEI